MTAKIQWNQSRIFLLIRHNSEGSTRLMHALKLLKNCRSHKNRYIYKGPTPFHTFHYSTSVCLLQSQYLYLLRSSVWYFMLLKIEIHCVKYFTDSFLVTSTSCLIYNFLIMWSYDVKCTKLYTQFMYLLYKRDILFIDLVN